jgi:glycosyltransferase involved in cell wall biosynthesis
MGLPLVSVNITTYNRAVLLERCLRSVLNQSYGNFEVVVVDDASTDHTQELVRKYIEADSRIKYFLHDNNRGNAVARNTGWEHSKGEFIAFMDDDDEWIDLDKTKKQVEFLLEHPEYDATYTDVISIDDSLKAKQIKNSINHESEFLRRILTNNALIFSPTVMVRSSMLQKTNGFDINIKKGVDADFYRTSIFKHKGNFKHLSFFSTLVHRDHVVRMGKSNSEINILNWIKTIEYNKKKYSDELNKCKYCLSYWHMNHAMALIQLFHFRKEPKTFFHAYRFLILQCFNYPSLRSILRFHLRLFSIKNK